ncbi:M20/M25/M40 family metallo-hydrolase [Saccharothrix variisporea]|uniref:Acetylornithine deacetylase n=1 Tax=Saccharothrix variisporea TaxID=543527 RepID=A0A495XT30_9PSEU|nr:M20/M25/M40 family metallo-hydrolase [Saccharothrix variisporea]RKT74818.1 acetylornithine deacetylase [Saccharothrix variisporea]
MRTALHVVKLGSATMAHPAVFAEVAELARRARVLLVAGGAAGIAAHYREIGREVPLLRLRNGDEVRHCTPEEMAHLVDAYERVTLPGVRSGLSAHGLAVFTATGASGLATATPAGPLRASVEGKQRIVRDHRIGTVSSVDTGRLAALLDAYDVVVLSPPVAASDGGTPLNVDADVLAAELSNALHADHLRLVTGTPGLLADRDDPATTVTDLHPGEGAAHAGGRMRQKVRAAELALRGSADVAITGPHTLHNPAGTSRFWPAPPPRDELTLLSRVVAIPSVSHDEGELARYLVGWCAERGIDAFVDEVGNFVATKGEAATRGEAGAARRLLMLGHLDTVPFHWPVRWDGDVLTGRGSVDAKGCLANFVEVLAAIDVPPGYQLRVVGAVEEEVSSSRGAFHVRDHYPADAVIVGEPSGVDAVTLGYFGLFKLRLSVRTPTGHSAGKEAVTAPDALIALAQDVRDDVLKLMPEALSALISLDSAHRHDHHTAEAVLNFRVPPGADLDAVTAAALRHRSVEVLRRTPGHAGKRSTVLAKAFGRAFARQGLRPRYLVKKGTSDMNTLATTWRDVPMVAYGPGDSALDHTDDERITGADYVTARAVLADAVAHWIALTGAG